jgi:hypothetical protein
MNPIHEDSLAAWADLKKRGGLELRGRDEGVEEELKNRLAPSAGSLELALRQSTPDDLVRAFFDLLQPFAAMFRDILQFFERAGATEGREQWNIMVDDVDLRLEHFRRFLKKWNSVPCEIELPAVDFHGAWGLLNVTRDMPEMEDAHVGVGTKQPDGSGFPDVDDWLRAYREPAGRYAEWPRSLTPSSLGAGYSDVAALGLAAVHTIAKGYHSREELVEEHRKRGFAYDRDDGLSIRTIAQNETDYWLETLVAGLAHSQSLPPAVKRDLGERLQEEFARYPRKKFGAQINIADLQSYLSLPIWQKRHELYAIWIATEIINALPDHTCDIHNEDGKIIFAFRETLVATVISAWPPIRLISERRVRLSEPVGKGRSGNVQPDYGLWRNEAGIETCGMVVEVKHYKRSAPSSFGDVLTDYSGAFPKAQVYLVNHGPIGGTMRDIPRDLLARCHTIENLKASHLSARDELHKAVRNYVGKPVVLLARKSGAGKRAASQLDTVLAIDVSPSMSHYFCDPDFFEIVQQVADDRCGNAALIDIRIRAVVPLDSLPEAIASAQGSDTSLGGPVEELLGTFKRVLVITDDEGFTSLRPVANQTVIAERSGLIVIEVIAS